MMMRRRGLLILPLLFLAGCSILSSKPSRFYSLEPLPPATRPAGITTRLPLGIDVVLPPGVNRKEIVTRQADHQLAIRGRELWTAMLEPLVNHTLAVDVADRLPDGMVILPGQPKPDAGARSVDVVVEELAAGPDPSLVLDARWTLHQPGKSDLAGHERIVTPLDTMDSAKIADAMSRALAALADRITAKIATP